jgi:transposase-like protein
MPLSRTVAPYSPTRTPPPSRQVRGHRAHLAPFIPVTNPLELFNREIGRRSDVVGIYPNDQALIRLVSMLAIEANDEWLVGRGYIAKHSMEPLLEERLQRAPTQEVLELTPA